MSKVPLLINVLPDATDPGPDKANVAPEFMVAVVRTLEPLRVCVPPATVRAPSIAPANVPTAFATVRLPITVPVPVNDLTVALLL